MYLKIQLLSLSGLGYMGQMCNTVIPYTTQAVLSDIRYKYYYWGENYLQRYHL